MLSVHLLPSQHVVLPGRKRRCEVAHPLAQGLGIPTTAFCSVTKANRTLKGRSTALQIERLIYVLLGGTA